MWLVYIYSVALSIYKQPDVFRAHTVMDTTTCAIRVVSMYNMEK